MLRVMEESVVNTAAEVHASCEALSIQAILMYNEPEESFVIL